jgi:hypothetical protein
MTGVVCSSFLCPQKLILPSSTLFLRWYTDTDEVIFLNLPLSLSAHSPLNKFKIITLDRTLLLTIKHFPKT